MTASGIRPVRLGLTPTGDLQIDFADGQVRRYSVQQLRDACPCATCREKRSQPPAASLLPVLSVAEAQPLRLAGMQPVGNYAYSIRFSDGHDTGIYTFDALRQLGEPVTQST